MKELSLSVYAKKVNNCVDCKKLNSICFSWFVYTFLNYKYNVLLKRDDVCLMLLSTFVTLSHFDEGEEIRIVRGKMTKKSNV